MKKKIIIVSIIAWAILAAAVVLFGIAFFSIRQYLDKYTWSKTFIAEEGRASVTGDYAKGDIMEISFADVVVERVRRKSGTSISTDADIIYNGKVCHKVTLKVGDGCTINKDGQTANIKIEGIGGY